MKKILWLDDFRNPFLNIEGRVPKENGIIEWVLNYDEFVLWIEKFGLPDIISFDHDLADEHYTPEEYWNDYEASKAYQESQDYKEKTGMECAKWLVNYCIDNEKALPIFYVHSANTVGADNIRLYLENYIKHYPQNNLPLNYENWLDKENIKPLGKTTMYVNGKIADSEVVRLWYDDYVKKNSNNFK